MKLDRTSIQTLVIGYLKVLKQYRLADFDANDANYTLYQKMEWPTFIAMLTPSGRKFVEFLRSRLANQRSVCDQQFFNLEYIPHVFIDIIEWFDADNEAFGPVVRSLLVQFNRYLNDYVLLDFKLENEKIKIRNSQHIGFEELRYYIQKELGEIDKNHFIVRHQDELISPLCCWLEEFIDCSVPIPIEQIEMKAPSHRRSLAIELINTMSPGSIAFDVVVEQGDDILQMWAAGATAS